jgi:hypothetical protein
MTWQAASAGPSLKGSTDYFGLNHYSSRFVQAGGMSEKVAKLGYLGRTVQVEPMKPMLKAPGTKRVETIL